MPIDPQMVFLKRRRTKIVATIGPSSHSLPMIESLIQAGVDVFRLNMSHGEPRFHQEAYQRIRSVAETSGQPIAIIADLCGPKLRVGVFAEGSIVLQTGDIVTVTTRNVVGEPGLIPSQYTALSQEVSAGHRILLADGLLALQVEQVQGSEIVCTVAQGGILRSRQGMNLPGVPLSIPSLTPKDREDAAFALELGVDYLALSFVRKASDIQDLREIIQARGKKTGIVSKIEKPQALQEIEQIITHSDAIMVARGDLGVELPAEQVPWVQDELVNMARAYNRPVIVATQMLESMIENARPTRAEVSDVTHAVMRGADAVMLSGETAMGKHPVDAVKTMDRIARQSEGFLWQHGAFGSIVEKRDDRHHQAVLPVQDAVANATSLLSRELGVRSIVIPTQGGNTVRIACASRPAAPMLALSPSLETCRRLNLCWGVVPVYTPDLDDASIPALARQVVQQLQLAQPGHYLLLLQGFDDNPAQNQPAITVLRV